MKSRLLGQLDAAIASIVANPIKADCLRTERACLLARQGQLDEARAVHATLQAQYAAQPNASVSAWLCLADGLVCYFGDMSSVARDKMRRAYALSAAVRDMRLHALASAWLAHMDYVEHDFEVMARHLGEAFLYADAEHHSARARACLVVAQAYHFGGRFDSAQPWYTKSRQHASTEGDEAMLSAVMHNMAAFLTNEARNVVLRGSKDSAETSRVMLNIESTGNFDALVGTASLNALVPLLRAQVSALQGRWAEAVALYESHFNDGLAQGLERMRASLGADLAWCRLQLGQAELALQDATAAAAKVEHDRDVDDRAAAHSRLSQVFAQLGQADAAARHAAQAALDWQAHEKDQQAVVALLDKEVAKLLA